MKTLVLEVVDFLRYKNTMRGYELFDYSEYDLPIPPSQEVTSYEERYGYFLETDWNRREHQYYETRSPLTHVPALGVLACGITARDMKREIQAIEAHFELNLVPDYIDFE